MKSGSASTRSEPNKKHGLNIHQHSTVYMIYMIYDLVNMIWLYDLFMPRLYVLGPTTLADPKGFPALSRVQTLATELLTIDLGWPRADPVTGCCNWTSQPPGNYMESSQPMTSSSQILWIFAVWQVWRQRSCDLQPARKDRLRGFSKNLLMSLSLQKWCSY